MEVMGTLASGAAIAGIGYQIIESVCKIQQIITAIQDAPKKLKVILEEIAIVTNVLIQYAERPQPFSTGSSELVARDQALLHCEAACKDLFDIVSKIEDGIRQSKFCSKRYSVLAVLKEKKITSLLERLERTKSTLALAQLMYLQSLEIERLGRKENTWAVSAMQRPKSLSSTTVTIQNEDDEIHGSYNETTFQLGIGVLVVRHISTTDGVNLTSLGVSRVYFRFADWFLRWGIQMAIGREFGNFKIMIRPHRLVPADSAIFQACALGDDEAVARLIQEGKASPFDMTSEGVTPLHVAAAWLHPSTTRQLLEYGADGSLSIRYHGIFWNPLGLAVERAGYYRYFIFPGLENYRPEPEEGLLRMRETMRILVEHGSVDMHQGYKSGERGRWNGSGSALHMFRGSAQDFLWLIKRENAFMAAKDLNDYISSIVFQQTQMFPNDSFPAAFSQVPDMKALANYKNSAGSSLLHYLLDTNFGTEPGLWMNGLDVFHFIRILLEHGADPSARDDCGNTPLMNVAQNTHRYFWSKGLQWTPEAASEVYFGFISRWIKTLQSCHIDFTEYHSREVESGAENFAICGQMEDDDNNEPYSATNHWFVRLVFEQDDAQQELRIKFHFQCNDKDSMMPGAWPYELRE